MSLTAPAALVFDYDGTLLTSDRGLTQATYDALRTCHRREIPIYIATARPHRLIFRPAEIGLDADFGFLTERGVFYNGAMAIDEGMGHVRQRLMSADVADAVTRDLVEAGPDVQVVLQFGEQHHAFRLPMDDSEVADWGFVGDELLPFADAGGRACSKIVAWRQGRDVAGVHRGIRDRHGEHVNALLSDSGHGLLITAAEARKEIALQELLSLRGIAYGDAVVFGDDTPDVGMFEAFGRSVAMGNAIAELKQAATYVTKSSDQDGVAFALREYLGVV